MPLKPMPHHGIIATATDTMAAMLRLKLTAEPSLPVLAGSAGSRDDGQRELGKASGLHLGF